MDTPVFMGDGSVVPELMTEDELIRFLRLRELGCKNPSNTLRYYRSRGVLRACRIGGRNAYTRRAALNFLEKLTEKS